MIVDLIDYTGRGHPRNADYAAALLIWTKRTRVEMSPGGFDEILAWPEEKKLEELRYMAATLPSSWEFVDFVFLFTGVTRAFTHQLVRTRYASYAQQNMSVMRVDEKKGWHYLAGPTITRDSNAHEKYSLAMDVVSKTYTDLVDNHGVAVEDARGVLPTNILTNIVMKVNLRILCDLLRKRASPRNQGAKPGMPDGEWTVARYRMRALVLTALPWTKVFIDRAADKVAEDLYRLLERVDEPVLRTNITKLVDQLMTNVSEELG